MTDDMIALSRRAVACRGWRWMPGVLRLRDTPPSRRDHLRMEGRVPDGGDTWDYAAWPVIPDLTDPATVGCLLALVRAAYPDAYTVPQFGGGWEVASPVDADVVGDGLSEAESLVAALESAP